MEADRPLATLSLYVVALSIRPLGQILERIQQSSVTSGTACCRYRFVLAGSRPKAM